MLDQIWRDHCKAFTLIINLFLKLDRTSKSGGLWETGLEIFGRLVCQKKIEQKTVRCTKISQEIAKNENKFRFLVYCR